MRNLKKIVTIAIALILVMIIPTSVLITNAQTAANPLQETTNAFLSVTPNPVQVNQPLSLVMFLGQLPPFDTNGGVVPYTGFTVNVTNPSGANTVLGPITSDDVGTAYNSYTPTTTGSYLFQFFYAGQTSNISSTFSGASKTTIIAQFLPSHSPVINVTVQAQPITTPQYPNQPGPQQYWSAPVEATLYGLSPVTGNWLGVPYQFGNGNNNNEVIQGAANPYTNPVETAHVIWTKQLAMSGLVGGEWGSQDYYTGLSYTARWNTAQVVLNGYLYYNIPTADYNSVGEGCACVNLRTGQQVWSLNNVTINLGQVLNYVSINQAGIIPYIWSTGSTYRVYDPLTGHEVTEFANASSGSIVYDNQGDMLVYNLGSNYVQMWNSTLCFINNGMQIYSSTSTANEAGTGEWRPLAGTYDWTKGIQWKTTVPTVSGQTVIHASPDVILAEVANITAGNFIVMGYSAATGTQLWNYTVNEYNLRAQYNFTPIQNDTYAWFDQNNLVWYGYNALTGQKIWGPTTPYTNPWGFYSESYMGTGINSPTIYNDVIYSTGYDGIHAISLSNGTQLWYFSVPSGYDTPYGDYPFYGGPTVAGGIVYAGVDEHSPNPTLFAGYNLYAINATTGEELWNLPIGYAPSATVADGVLVDYSNYDGNIYALAKGPTATTVSATPAQGTGITIQGTVTDQSPGTTGLGIPEAGTPAISDASMSQWMEYLFMQYPEPTNATGVPVTLMYTDPNNNAYTIGTTTSDASGHYSYVFTPTVPGLYTVTATFGGSNSYYSSSAEASFTYTPTTTTATPTPAPVSMADLYFVPSVIAIIVIMIIGFAVLAVISLRKRP
jgi:outer membrane protein assembly factor BamB